MVTYKTCKVIVRSMDLFDCVKRSLKTSPVFWVSHKDSPRTISKTTPHWPEGEESEFTIGHVVVLSSEEKLRHDRKL